MQCTIFRRCIRQGRVCLNTIVVKCLPNTARMQNSLLSTRVDFTNSRSSCQISIASVYFYSVCSGTNSHSGSSRLDTIKNVGKFFKSYSLNNLCRSVCLSGAVNDQIMSISNSNNMNFSQILRPTLWILKTTWVPKFTLLISTKFVLLLCINFRATSMGSRV